MARFYRITIQVAEPRPLLAGASGMARRYSGGRYSPASVAENSAWGEPGSRQGIV